MPRHFIPGRATFLAGVLAGVFVFNSAILVTPAAASPSASRTAVLLVGGIGSNPMSPLFAILRSDLTGSLGYQGDIWDFSYDPASAPVYTPAETCQPLAQSRGLLVGALRWLRSQGYGSAVVVGHSLGGVLAFDALASNPDLSPFVREVITVDSPLGGTYSGSAFVEALRYDLPNCQAVQDIGVRDPDWVTGAAGAMLARGTTPMIVVNPNDWAVSWSFQMVPGSLAVNYVWPSSDGGSNHSAVLQANPAAVWQIAQWIGPQGQ
jgi:pimeloyl-ACP methyl ester carboxylesterase